ILLTLRRGGAMGRSHEIGILGEHQREDQLRLALPKHGRHHEGEKDRREGQLDVHNAHDERFDAPAGMRVREAFDLVIDRETLVEYALEGMGVVSTQLVTPNIFGYNKDIPVPEYNVEKAKQLMAEAGYPEGFKVSLAYANDRMPTELGPTIAQMLSAINVTVDVQGVPAAVFNPAKTRGEYSLYMASWGTLTGEANYMLSSLMHTNDPEKSMGAFNVRGYSNAKMDELIQAASVEMDEAKRRALLEEAN